MSEKKDYYEVLGAKKGATEAELKTAYRKKSREWHPDINHDKPDAAEKMKEINEAYDILSDAQKRAAYDRYGHAAFSQGTGASAGAGSGGGFDFNDIFGGAFQGSMGDIFGDFFGGGGSARRSGPKRGRDVEYNLQIDLEEAVFGAEREISVSVVEACGNCKGTGAKPGTSAETCKDCKGTGQTHTQAQTIFGIQTVISTCPTCRGEGKVIKDPCPRCNGSGGTRQNKKLNVTIPKGIDNGQAISLSGKGEPGERGGPNGDIIINMYIRPHKTFKRQGVNLMCDLPISIVTAALGGEVSIPTLYGEEKYDVRPGTQPETRITLRGKGVPNVRNNRAVGDLIINIKVNVPTSLTDRQKELLREFNGESPEGNGKVRKKRFGK